ncbi:MAG: class D sortase [Acidobacteria bacterium]|nr:class D sortase [Acidobacteriota bacterium]
MEVLQVARDIVDRVIDTPSGAALRRRTASLSRRARRGWRRVARWLGRVGGSDAGLRWVRYALTAFGVVMLGTYAVIQLQAAVFQAWGNRLLERELEAEPVVQGEIRPLPPAPLAKGDLLGRLTVARLDLSVIVVEGTDDDELRRAAGHLPASAVPGQPGNVAIAGHRDTFFRPLQEIRRNDVITMTTPHGTYSYRVDLIRIVDPEDVWVLADRAGPSLTLITCFPFYYVGHAPKRFIVHAEELPQHRPGDAAPREPAPPKAAVARARAAPRPPPAARAELPGEGGPAPRRRAAARKGPNPPAWEW